MRPTLIAVVLLPLLFSLPLQSQPAYLVADLNTQAQFSPASSNPRPLVTHQGRLFFTAFEPSAGRELWVTDGMPQNTQMLADTCPGMCGSRIAVVATAGNLVFFTADTDSDDRQLWRTDGTRRGTFMLTAGGSLFLSSLTPNAATVGRAIYFSACSEDTCGLWRSDGTQAGTTHIHGFGTIGDNPLSAVAAAGSKLFLLVNGGLWTSDGTAGGTVLVKDIDQGSRSLVIAGGRAFFFGETDELGEELWVSDGTEAGTHELTQFPRDPDFRWLKALGGKVYFTADDVLHGTELWASDGKAAGTLRVTDFGYFSPFPQSRPEHVEQLGKQLLFVATDGLSGFKLWATSGKGAPVPLATVCPDDFCGLDGIRLVKVGNRVFFPADDGVHGTEIWSTDGTARGTVLTRDVCSGGCSSYRSNTLVSLLGSAFFLGSTTSDGLAIWRSDGTPEHTRRFARIGFGSDDFSIVALGNRVFYPARDAYGEELWSSDGTLPGTRLVTDAARSAASSQPRDLLALGSHVFFYDCEDFDEKALLGSSTPGDVRPIALGRESCGQSPPAAVLGNSILLWRRGFPNAVLWRVAEDGTALKVAELDGDSTSTRLIPLKGELYFERRSEVWKTDGTPQGTQKVFGLPAGFALSNSSLTAVGDELYFVTELTGDDEFGQDLWRSGGTHAGTRRLTAGDLDADFGLRFGRTPSAVLFFQGFFNVSLWRTDGTAAGTVPVGKSFDGEPFGPYPTGPVLLRDAGYFLASDFDEQGLWRSDGTAEGTFLVKPLVLGDEDFGAPSPQVTLFDGKLFFVVGDGVHGAELWTSDGTAAGTVMVKDVRQGPGTSEINDLRAGGGRLWFSANDGIHGFELWTSDGTAAGTRLVQDLAPLGASSFPSEPTAVGDRLFFAADDGLSGRELWALPLGTGSGVCQASSTTLCLGGRYKVEAVWKDPANNTGPGQAVALTADTGYFWLFNEANVEIVLKVLDGQPVNGHVWVFYGALSNVEYTLTVTDVQTGLTRRYFNPAGRLASMGDTQAFGPLGAYKSALTTTGGEPPVVSVGIDLEAAKAPCRQTSGRLCLNGGRFAVEASWKIPGQSGNATAVRLTGDTGYFWFFDAANVEVVLKVLDGRPVNGKFWVFAGALSDVEYTLTVTDTATGKVKTYTNPKGRLASFADITAF